MSVYLDLFLYKLREVVSPQQVFIIFYGISLWQEEWFMGRAFIIDIAKEGSPDKPGGLSIQLCKSEKKEFYIRYSS